MARSQNMRNAVLLLIIIIGVIYYFTNRPPGPAAVNTPDPHGDQMVENPHAGGIPDVNVEMNAGTPAITFGDNWVGRDWLDAKTEQYANAQLGQDSPHGADPDAPLKLALFEGVTDLVYRDVLTEFGIEVDPDELAERESGFYATFETEAEAQQLLNSMNMTMEQVRNMWREESERDQFVARIAEMNSLDPGSMQSESAANEWLLNRIAESDLVFADEDEKAAFEADLEWRLASQDNLATMENEPDHGSETENEPEVEPDIEAEPETVTETSGTD